MLRKRIIPVLLLSGRGLVKTVNFDQAKYVGDPINAVRIFNEKEVDELVFLDIQATKENRLPDFDLVEKIAAECFMPFAYGGGVRNLEQMSRLFSLGVEKVILNNILFENLELLKRAADKFGCQSVIASIDVKKNFWGKKLVYNHLTKSVVKIEPHELAQKVENAGAGEIIVNSVDHDGLQTGYDGELISRISSSVSIPVVACGGASSLEDMARVIKESGASAAAAGSFFVFKGKHRAVLITYPLVSEIDQL